MTVPGEEQGLLGSTHFAEEAKKSNMDIESMFTNDIIGSSLGGKGVRDSHTVRVFSEGVPSNETQAESMSRRSVGGENDSASRQLARFIKETGERGIALFRLHCHGKSVNITLSNRQDDDRTPRRRTHGRHVGPVGADPGEEPEKEHAEDRAVDQ